MVVLWLLLVVATGAVAAVAASQQQQPTLQLTKLGTTLSPGQLAQLKAAAAQVITGGLNPVITQPGQMANYFTPDDNTDRRRHYGSQYVRDFMCDGCSPGNALDASPKMLKTDDGHEAKLLPAGCTSDIHCSLNGACVAGACDCDKPWKGPACGVLSYTARQPLIGKNLYPHNDTGAPKSGPCVTAKSVCDALNTWNGPIVGPVDGKYHMYNPLYKKGTLYSTVDMMHGVATSIEGPYTWISMGNMGPNPAFVTYNDTSGKTKYSLWVGGKVHLADSPDGPFQQVPGSTPGGTFADPAPLFHNGSFYMTNQATREVLTAKAPGGPWTKFADILPHLRTGKQEDPFMWIDRRGTISAQYLSPS